MFGVPEDPPPAKQKVLLQKVTTLPVPFDPAVLKECKDLQDQYGLELQRTWGSMPADVSARYINVLNCKRFDSVLFDAAKYSNTRVPAELLTALPQNAGHTAAPSPKTSSMPARPSSFSSPPPSRVFSSGSSASVLSSKVKGANHEGKSEESFLRDELAKAKAEAKELDAQSEAADKHIEQDQRQLEEERAKETLLRKEEARLRHDLSLQKQAARADQQTLALQKAALQAEKEQISLERQLRNKEAKFSKKLSLGGHSFGNLSSAGNLPRANDLTVSSANMCDASLGFECETGTGGGQSGPILVHPVRFVPPVLKTSSCFPDPEAYPVSVKRMTSVPLASDPGARALHAWDVLHKRLSGGPSPAPDVVRLPVRVVFAGGSMAYSSSGVPTPEMGAGHRFCQWLTVRYPGACTYNF